MAIPMRMMGNSIRPGVDGFQFRCTALEGTGKQGILPQNSDGSYTVVVGGLGIVHSNGEVHNPERLRECLQANSDLMRRITEGTLRGENGHPVRDPSMSRMDWFKRIMTIAESRICVHFDDLTVGAEPAKDRMGQWVTPIIARIRPAGELGYVTEQEIKDPKQNICFSIRALVTPMMSGGRRESYINTLVTYDKVNEGGAPVARKWSSPSLQNQVVEADELDFFNHQIIHAVYEEMQTHPESLHQSYEMIMDLRSQMKRLQMDRAAAPVTW